MRDFPAGPALDTLPFMQGLLVRSLVRELGLEAKKPIHET